MNMRRMLGMLTALCVAVCVSFALAACGKPAQTEKKEGASPQPEQKSAQADLPDLKTDVVVVGAGTTGIVASINAHDAGAKVVLLEKMPVAGGNSVRAEGGMNAAWTEPQKKAGIEDSPELFYEDTMKGGHNKSNPEILKYFTQSSSDAINWLLKEGMDVNEVAQAAGASRPRMHRPVGGASIGAIMVDSMLKKLHERNIFVRTNQDVTEILMDNGKATGVKVTDKKSGKSYKVMADAVVLTTGGFGANQDLIVKYRPDLKGFGTTNHPGATGDGIKMAEAVGADTVDMDQIQTNPTVEPTTLTVLSESIRGQGAIFINTDGKRFCNEMGTRDVLSAEILKQPNKFVYEVFDQGVRDRMKAIEKLVKLGIVTEGATMEELAGKLNIDPATFKASMEEWNGYVAAKKDAAYERPNGMDHDLSKGPFYAVKVSPAVHYTMGGIKINDTTAVINKDGKVIEGLYAAGETTGGLHGGNRLGGNAVADTVIFGLRAGDIASKYALQNGSLYNADEAKKEFEAAQAKKAKPDSDAPALYKDGTYVGEGKGKEGQIEVKVTVKDGRIIDIETTKTEDTPTLFKSAEDAIYPKVIMKQKLDVENAGGATLSSEGIKAALNSALKDAKK